MPFSNLKLSVILPNKNEWGMKLNCWTVGGKSSTLSLKIWNAMLTSSGENEIKSVTDFVPHAPASIVKQYSLLLFICLFCFLWLSFAPIWAIWMIISRKLSTNRYAPEGYEACLMSYLGDMRTHYLLYQKQSALSNGLGLMLM